jgi:hypothetical protein
MMEESVNEGGYMIGQRLREGIMKIWGGNIIFGRRGLYFLFLDIFWFWEFGFGGWLYCCRGHQVAGSFGLEGQESLRNPGAREPNRLLLAGWVVSRFWAEFSTISASAWTNRDQGFSIRQRYFYLCIFMNM